MVCFCFSLDVDYVIGNEEMHFRWQVLFNVIEEFGNRDLVIKKLKGATVSYLWFKESYVSLLFDGDTVNSNLYFL